MVYFLLFLYFLYFVWDNFYDIMILINEKVLLIKAIYYKHNCSYNSFKKISKNIINCGNGDDILVYEYDFRGENYIILCDETKFIDSPYTADYIDTMQNKDTIEILKKTKDDIISAELIIKDKQGGKETEVDYHSKTQQLSGPLGDFYENTRVEMVKKDLMVYLMDKFPNFEIKALNIMTSDGEEFNILQ